MKSAVVTPADRLARLAEALLQHVTPGDLLVGSDFDGTLAPIVARPEQAAALPEGLAALAALVRRGVTVAVISGRSPAALSAAVPLPGVHLLGDYGLVDPSPADRAALDEFNRQIRGRIAGLSGVVLEAKPGSTSLHFRDNPPAGDGLLEAAKPVAERLGLRADAGRMVVEVRPPGADKGAALGALIAAEKPAAVAFAGDDENDRAAFEVAARQTRHLVVGVASAESRADLFEACDAIVEGPAGWVRVLREIDAALG